MRRRLPIALALLGLAAAAPVASPLSAQQALQVTASQALRFGIMLPGRSAVALRTDPATAAAFDITGQGTRQLQIAFTLPGAMSGPGGATIPLAFGPADAGFSRDRSIASQVSFDPRVPYLAQLRGGRGSVFLGGTATPSANQPSGNYTATLTITVIYFP